MADTLAPAGFYDYTDAYAYERARQTSRRRRASWPDATTYYRNLIHTRDDDRRTRRGCVGATTFPLPPGPVDYVDHLNADFDRFAPELAWVNAGRPYYRVYPDYVDAFARTRLAIPLEHLALPFPAFAVRFAVGAEPARRVDGSVWRMRCLLVSMGGPAAARALDLQPVVDAGTSHTLGVTAEFRLDGDPPAGVRVLMFNMGWSDAAVAAGETVASIHARTTASGYKSAPLSAPARRQASIDAVGADMLAVALTVAFLATGGDKIIDPDVINADLKDYLVAVNAGTAAGRETALDLAAKAERARGGRRGFTVGRADAILGRRAREAEPADDDISPEERALRRELAYQHQPSGHVHLFYTKDGPVRKWVNCHTVRPDLPPDPRRRGARTPRDKAEEARMAARGG